MNIQLDKKPEDKNEEVYWWAIHVHHMPLSVIREFKDKLDFPFLRPGVLPFYNILRYNENIDFDFIRELVNEFKDKIDLREVMSIIDYRFGSKHYLELLRMWVDWNIEHKTKGLY